VLVAPLGIVGAWDADAAATARATLAAMMGDSAVGGRAAWTLALDAWHRGDSAAARAFAYRLSPRDTALRTILGAVDAGRHAPRQALDLTDRLRGVREEQNGLGEPFARAILHLRRAEWYDAIGERENAERELRWHENSDFSGWLQGSIQSAEVDWAAGAYVRARSDPAHRRRGHRRLRRPAARGGHAVDRRRTARDALRRAGRARAACL
jgi:hypothetical protein